MKRPAGVLLYLAAVLVLLEAGLQVASIVVYLTHSRAEVSPGSEGGGTILCIGDSYTYGVGTSTSDNTYPAVMARRLKDQSGVEPTVINAGWPGQNSRDLLSRLDAQLERFDPDLVFILIGLNDTWSRPDLLELAEVSGEPAGPPGSRWTLRWRTGRLLARTFGGRETARERESTTRESPARVRREAAVPSGGSRDLFDRAVAYLGAGNHQAAARAFEEALTTQPQREAEIRQGLIQTYAILGMRDEAEASLAWLEVDYARDGSLATTEALVASLSVLRENARAFGVAEAGVQAFPDSSQLWWFLGEQRYRTGQLGLAEEAYDRALSLAEPDDTAWRAILMRAGARTCAERDPEKSLRLVISSLLLDGDMGKSLVALRPGREHYSPQLAEEILADLNLPPRAEQASKQLLAALFSMQDQPRNPGTAGVLESHLRQMIDLSTAHGAQPVLVTYPMPVPDVEQVAAKLAAETGAELVDMRQRLEAAARSQPSEAFFIPDGHCSDSGYRIMGETAAAAAGRLLDP